MGRYLEVEEAAKNSNFKFSGVDPPQHEGDAYGLRYAEFVVPLVKAVQELNQKVDQQEKMLQAQAEQIKAYEDLVAKDQSQDSQIDEYQKQLTQYQQLLSNLSDRLNALELNENKNLSAVRK